MQTLRKRRWVLIVSLVLAGIFSLVFSNPAPAFAADQFNCTYTFNSTKSTISRTDCDANDDVFTPEATFKKTATNTYTFSETITFYGQTTQCTQTVVVSSNGTSGKISGKYGGNTVASGVTVPSCIALKESSVAIGGVDNGGGGSQSGTGKCSYAYNPKKTSILRSNCGEDAYINPDATFKSTGSKTFEHSEKVTPYRSPEITCTQKITVGSDASKGKLSGSIGTTSTAGGVGTQLCSSLGNSDITIASTYEQYDESGPDQATYVATITDKLDNLITKHCPGDAAQQDQVCRGGYIMWIQNCTAEVAGKIKESDENKNQKFRDGFAECMAKNTKMTKKEVSAALGPNIWDDLQAAVKLSEGGDEEEEPDSCNVSGSPLTWIICPIYDGFASLSDTIMESVVKDFLQTDPISTSKTNPDGTPNGIYKAWSAFRIWGDIFLVIALLVIVFGEAIGGGLVDAYTAKKVLPRLLIAAILINLSLYIVALLVDFTNVLGQSIGNLITAPFDGISLSPTGWKNGIAAGSAALGVAAGVGIVGFLLSTTTLTVGALVGPYVPFLLLSVVAPVLLAILLVWFTLVIRKAIIIALVLISPIAFALYCLPNTEKYFRQWWDLLFKTLLIYPVVMVVFAVCDVLAYTTLQANGTDSVMGYLVAFMLQFIPLLLIPYAFKLAGGVVGRISDVATGYGKRGLEGVKGDARDPDSFRARATRMRREGNIRNRENAVSAFKTVEKNQGNIRTADMNAGRRSSYRNRLLQSGAARAGRMLNYGDLELARSRMTKEEAQRREDKTNFGPDNSVRAFFAEPQPDGTYKSMTTGKLFSAAEYQKAQQLYGGGVSSAQTAVDYELGKAEPHQYDAMALNAASLLTQKGFTDEEVQGIMVGVGYKNQAKYLDLKHSGFSPVKDSADKTIGWERSVNHAALAQNAAVDFGSYPISNMKPAPIKALRDAHTQAERALALPSNATEADYEALGFKKTSDGIGGRELAERTLKDVELTAATLDTSYRYQQAATGRPQQVGEAEGGVPVAGGSSGAPGRVNYEIQELVSQVRNSQSRRGTPPSTPPTPPSGGSGPSGPSTPPPSGGPRPSGPSNTPPSGGSQPAAPTPASSGPLPSGSTPTAQSSSPAPTQAAPATPSQPQFTNLTDRLAAAKRAADQRAQDSANSPQIITPGSSDFTIPPGNRPPGE